MRVKCKNWPNNKHCCTNTCRDCKCNYRCKYCRRRLGYDYPMEDVFIYVIKHRNSQNRIYTYRGRFCDEFCLEQKVNEYRNNPKVKRVERI